MKGNICIFGASSPKLPEVYIDAARELGTLMASHGWGCVNGGGRRGLMRAVSDGVLDGGGEVTGIIPQFMVDNGWQYDRLTHLLTTADMHERKREMQAHSRAVIALPGGMGTLEELTEVLTWRQLNIVVKPIVILNTAGYYDKFIAMFDHGMSQGFIPELHRAIFQVASTPAEALALVERGIEEGVVPTPPKFHDR